MKRLLMLGLALALVVPAAAAAKGELEMGSVMVCGPSGCGPFDDEGSLRWLSGLMYAERPTTAEAPPVSSYYELRWADDGLGDGAHSLGWVVPDEGAIASQRFVGSGGVKWFRLAGGIAGPLAAATTRIEPFPAPHLTRVYVGDREVADPGAYLALLGPLEPMPGRAAPDVPLGLVTAAPTPWTMPSSYAELWYSPDKDAVLVDGTWYRVPAELANRIDADAGVRQTSPPSAATPEPMSSQSAPTDQAGFPWALVAGLAGGIALLLGTLAVARRTRATGRGGGTQPA